MSDDSYQQGKVSFNKGVCLIDGKKTDIRKVSEVSFIKDAKVEKEKKVKLSNCRNRKA